MKEITLEKPIYITEVQFRILDALAQGDASTKDLKTSADTKSPAHHVETIEKAFGEGTVIKLYQATGNTEQVFRLQGIREPLHPDVFIVGEENLTTSKKFRSELRRSSNLPKQESILPQGKTALPSEYLDSLPQTEKAHAYLLVGTSFTNPHVPKSFQEYQVLETMRSVGAHPPGFKIKSKANGNPLPSYYLERI